MTLKALENRTQELQAWIAVHQAILIVQKVLIGTAVVTQESTDFQPEVNEIIDR